MLTIFKEPAATVTVSEIALNDLQCELKNMKKLGYNIKSGGMEGMYELLNAQSKGSFAGAFQACKQEDCSYVLKIQYIRPPNDRFVDELKMNKYIKKNTDPAKPFSPEFIGGFMCNTNDIIDNKLKLIGIRNECEIDNTRMKCKSVGYLLLKKFGKDLEKNNYIRMKKIKKELKKIYDQTEPISAYQLEQIFKTLFNKLIERDPDSLIIKNKFDEFFKKIISKNIQNKEIEKILISLLAVIETFLKNFIIENNNFSKIEKLILEKKSIAEILRQTFESTRSYAQNIDKNDNRIKNLNLMIIRENVNISEFETELNYIINSQNKIITEMQKLHKSIKTIISNYDKVEFYDIYISAKKLYYIADTESTYLFILGNKLIHNLHLLIEFELKLILVNKAEFKTESTNIIDKYTDPEITKDIIYEIFNKIGQMHNKEIIHNDIGFRNILFEKNTSGGMNILLMDFGYSSSFNIHYEDYLKLIAIIIKNISSSDDIDINNYIILNMLYDYTDLFYELEYYQNHLHEIDTDNMHKIKKEIINIFVDYLVIKRLYDFIKYKKFDCKFKIGFLDNKKYKEHDSMFYYLTPNNPKYLTRQKFITDVVTKIIKLLNDNKEFLKYVKKHYKDISVNTEILSNFSNEFKKCMY